VSGGLAVALLAAGCGGTRQDAHEPAQLYRMQVLAASFQPKQWVAKPTTMGLLVRNNGLRTVPNVAVTVDSFSYASNFPELAARKRPIWVIEQGPGRNAHPPVESVEVSKPGNAQTAYVNTWALGPLPPRSTALFRWVVVPVKPGSYTVHYRVAAGLAGKAKAISLRGPLAGRFDVLIAPKPPSRHVDPNTGKVVPGPAPPVSSP
jgi:hypothetical protein